MSEKNNDASLLELFVFETTQNIKRFEQIAMDSEKQNGFTKNDVDEIFRIMHTIKGSSAMMSFDNVAALAHRMEDLFSFMRDHPDSSYDRLAISELMLETADIIGAETEKISDGSADEADTGEILKKIAAVLEDLKGGGSGGTAVSPSPAAPPAVKSPAIDLSDAAARKLRPYKVTVSFEKDCGMENLRAFNLIIHLKDKAEDITPYPPNVENDTQTAAYIRDNGFVMLFLSALPPEDMEGCFAEEAFLKEISVTPLSGMPEYEKQKARFLVGGRQADEKGSGKVAARQDGSAPAARSGAHQGLITVNVVRLDELMDMIGELVIAESMVIHNNDLKGLELDSFGKAVHQLQKITNELQDLAMSIRMVPLSGTFQKMNRIVRDMTRKLGKEVNLVISGDDTEVDKNIIDHLSDPLMHLVRNAVDHGIEKPEDRVLAGKPEQGTVFLEARNDSGEIQIVVRDDGGGLDREKLLEHAKTKGLLKKKESEMTNKEVYSLIFVPGFSTNDSVNEYSGRGVGMDVVIKSVEALGGRVLVDSVPGKGTQFTIKFPMTLTIIEGMSLGVGDSVFTLPITAIRESLRPSEKSIIRDPLNHEMVLFRGKCLPIIRLHRLYHMEPRTTVFSEGIFIMIESGDDTVCLFADELLGENQVVVKPLPSYIKKPVGISGCTILGDGKIGLILDASELSTCGYGSSVS